MQENNNNSSNNKDPAEYPSLEQFIGSPSLASSNSNNINNSHNNSNNNGQQRTFDQLIDNLKALYRKDKVPAVSYSLNLFSNALMLVITPELICWLCYFVVVAIVFQAHRQMLYIEGCLDYYAKQFTNYPSNDGNPNQ